MLNLFNAKFFEAMSDNIQIKIGQEIRKIRAQKGLSLREFEKIVGITRGDISKIERGKKNLTTKTIEKIAKALECDAEILLNPKK